jgi:putative endonuclease
MICLDRETIIFVEVKTNTSKDFGVPESRVDSRKQRQIIKGALSFLKQRGKLNSDCRFDVVSILLMKNAKPEIEHIENAFQADGYLL